MMPADRFSVVRSRFVLRLPLFGVAFLAALGAAPEAFGQTPPTGAPPSPPAAAPPPAAPAPAAPAPEAPSGAPGAPQEPPADAPAATSASPAEGTGTTAAPAVEASADGTATTSAETSSGAGLFEQSVSEESTESSAEAGASRTFDLNGYVRGDLFAGKVPDSSKWHMKAAYGELALRLRTAKVTYGDAFAEARLKYGLQGDTTDMTVDLREAYVNTYLGPLDLRLGQQIIVWGRADAFNPTNNLTPADLRVRSPVEDDRRLGNVGARAFLNLQPIRIEGVWMPLYRPAELPIVVPDYVEFNGTDFPPPELDKGTQAARVHLELPAVEMSVSYLYGYAPLPGLVLTGLTPGVPQPVHVARKAYNHHVVGFDFSTAIGDIMGLRGEVAYRRPLSYETRDYAPRPDLQYVLGVDKTFGSVSVIAQYMGRYTFDWQRRTVAPLPSFADIGALQNPAMPLSEAIIRDTVLPNVQSEIAVRNQMLFQQLHEVQHLATVRIEWLTMHDTLSLSALGFVNFSTEEWLVFPKVGYQLSDNLSTSLGAEIYAGPTGTLLGTIDSQLSAGYAELRYGF